MTRSPRRRTPAGAAFNELAHLIFRLHGSLGRHGREICDRCGTTTARWQVLGALAGGPATVPAIGRTMGLTRQSVQRTVDLLERDRLVERRPNPAHERSPLFVLTRPGHELLGRLTGLQVTWSDRLAAPLEPGLLREAVHTLRGVADRLDATAPGDLLEPAAPEAP